MMRILAIPACLCLLLMPGLLLMPEWAAAETLDGAKLYETKACVICHGPEGREPAEPGYPTLVGQNAIYLARQIRAIQTGQRSGPLALRMRPVIQDLTFPEIQAISEYLASLDPAPK